MTRDQSGFYHVSVYDWKYRLEDQNDAQHVKIVKTDDGRETIMVPYDFDFAGIGQYLLRKTKS